jgi:hypothetical protein
MTLLLGNSETSFSSAKATTAKKAQAFAFTATETGLLEELQFRTNANANTGVTSVRLGVFVDSGGVPGNVIQEGVFTGTPGTNAWIAVSGLDIPILKNAHYWLVVLSIGGALHYSAHGSGGSTSLRTTSTEHTALYEFSEGSWEAASFEGPAGFQGLGRAGVGSERKILFGIDSGSQTNSGHTAWVEHKIVVGRGSPGLDFEYTENPTTVSTHVGEALAAGITVPLVIINTNDSTVLSSIVPSIYAEKAVAIIKKVVEQHPTVRTFEIINEPFLKGPEHRTSNASNYAEILLATYEALAVAEIGGVRLTGVTLLAAAYGTYQIVNSEGEGTGVFSDVHHGEGWVHDILATKPQLKEGGANPITGWTTHPYGKPTEISNTFDSGFLTTVALRETVKRNGGSGYNNWWVTEVGFNIGSTESSGVENEAQQSERLLEDLEQAQLLGEAGWLKALIVYADNAETWNIYGKTAGTTYQNFAGERGLIPTAAFTSRFSAVGALAAKLASTSKFSAQFTASSTLAAVINSTVIWNEATKIWEEVAVGVTWENVQRGEV